MVQELPAALTGSKQVRPKREVWRARYTTGDFFLGSGRAGRIPFLIKDFSGSPNERPFQFTLTRCSRCSVSEETAPNEEKFLFVDFSLIHSRMKVLQVELPGSPHLIEKLSCPNNGRF